VGHIREAERKVLVAGSVTGSALVRDNLRKLLNALHRHRDELHPT
jgi:hypothetical protein